MPNYKKASFGDCKKNSCKKDCKCEKKTCPSFFSSDDIDIEAIDRTREEVMRKVVSDDAPNFEFFLQMEDGEATTVSVGCDNEYSMAALVLTTLFDTLLHDGMDFNELSVLVAQVLSQSARDARDGNTFIDKSEKYMQGEDDSAEIEEELKHDCSIHMLAFNSTEGKQVDLTDLPNDVKMELCRSLLETGIDLMEELGLEDVNVRKKTTKVSKKEAKKAKKASKKENK